MEGAWWSAQNTRRMDPTRNGSICRHFLNGSCRLGPRCNFRHEWPGIPASQICRYFQKGGCWYGDHCKYFHVLQPEVVTATPSRRGSVPAVSSSSVAFASPDRRGSEPALLQAEDDGQHSRQECSRSQSAVNASNSRNAARVAANIAEEPSQETDSESDQSSRVAQAAACHGTKEEEESSSSVDGAAAAAAAAASGTDIEETEAFIQSKNITCGICMDKVYEKTHSRNQVFGILPNCNHAFCLECIMTWRKTKDLGPEVVKSCPQCRVKSPFYVPNKYWVEGQEKENVVAAFKERFSKKNCNYYSRYGCCPFKTDCLYRHNKPAHRTSSRHHTEDEDDDDDLIDLRNFVIAVTLLGDDDDVFDFLFTD